MYAKDLKIDAGESKDGLLHKSACIDWLDERITWVKNRV